MAQLAHPHPMTTPRLRISGEAVIYLPIVVLTLAIRLALLGAAPLDDAQAHEALAALHRIDPTTSSINPDDPLLPNNAFGSLFTSLGLLTFGSNDAAAKLATALAGSLLVLSPLLYRQYLGRIFPIFLALALMVSPIAIASARTMSGVTWAMLLVMVGGWLALRFAETREKWAALGATGCAAGVLFLTTPYGILIILGVFFGLSFAAITVEENPIRRTLADWPAFESLLVMVVTLIVVSTAFFTIPSGLSSVGQNLQTFAEGVSNRQPDSPVAYGLLVTLRYEIGWVIFAAIALWYAWDEKSLVERFLAGWFGWSLLCVTFYLGATPEMALLVVVPAAALTASLATRLTQEVSFGYWVVPSWFIPVHAVVVAGLLAALSVSSQSLALKLWEEARQIPFAKVLDFNEGSVRIGTITAEGDSSNVISLPHVTLKNCQAISPTDPRAANLIPNVDGLYCEEDITSKITIQISPLDDAVKEASFVIRNPNDEIVFGPEPIGDELITTFTATDRGEYRFDVVRGENGVTRPAQYMILVYLGNLTNQSVLEEVETAAFLLRFPEFAAGLELLSRSNSPNPAALIVVPMVLLMIPISFFLGGALYGARAAWRGVAFGFMLTIGVFGLALGYNMSTIYADDVRELWVQNPATEDLHTLQDVLEEMSRRENGTRTEIEVTVQAPRDGALAWALRNFSQAEYVPAAGVNNRTAAVITPETPAPSLGADYVGQQLVLGNSWERDSLNWTDFGSWWFQRRTRFAPEPSDLWRLWIVKQVYDVQNVPEG